MHPLKLQFFFSIVVEPMTVLRLPGCSRSFAKKLSFGTTKMVARVNKIYACLLVTKKKLKMFTAVIFDFFLLNA